LTSRDRAATPEGYTFVVVMPTFRLRNRKASSQPPGSPITLETPAAQAESEIEEYLSIRRQLQRVLPRAAVVGLFAGGIAIAFSGSLILATGMRNAILAYAHRLPAGGVLLPVGFSAVGAVLSVFLVRRYAPEARGSGVPHIKAVLHRLAPMRWRRVVPVKFLGGTLAIGSGLALGREGPTVQLGSAVGDAVARGLKSLSRERLTLTAAGAGAGLAAAFNAPLAGLVFVLEEVQRDFRPIVFAAAFIAAAVADIVARVASGQLPVFSVPSYPVPPLTTLPAFAVLGITAGLLGVAFNRGLLGTLDLFARFKGVQRLAAAGVVGASVGLVAWFYPNMVGSGHELAEQALAGDIALAALPLIFVLRYVLTLGSYGTSAPGGIFLPLLVLGSLLGLAVGQVTARLAPGWVAQPGIFAVVGMAAYFTAIVRAPLTGIVLILEMTGNYNQMLPLLVSCFCAYAVAEAFKQLPIYESLMARDIKRRGLLHRIREPAVLELEVEPGAPFAGMQVRDLGLPPGCILLRCMDGGREFVPTATTRLEPHTRVTAVIAPEAIAAEDLLRRGCEEPDRSG
jgi:CIC family chloride channel protein